MPNKIDNNNNKNPVFGEISTSFSLILLQSILYSYIWIIILSQLEIFENWGRFSSGDLKISKDAFNCLLFFLIC